MLDAISKSQNSIANNKYALTNDKNPLNFDIMMKRRHVFALLSFIIISIESQNNWSNKEIELKMGFWSAFMHSAYRRKWMGQVSFLRYVQSSRSEGDISPCRSHIETQIIHTQATATEKENRKMATTCNRYRKCFGKKKQTALVICCYIERSRSEKCIRNRFMRILTLKNSNGKKKYIDWELKVKCNLWVVVTLDAIFNKSTSHLCYP